MLNPSTPSSLVSFNRMMQIAFNTLVCFIIDRYLRFLSKHCIVFQLPPYQLNLPWELFFCLLKIQTQTRNAVLNTQTQARLVTLAICPFILCLLSIKFQESQAWIQTISPRVVLVKSPKVRYKQWETTPVFHKLKQYKIYMPYMDINLHLKSFSDMSKICISRFLM